MKTKFIKKYFILTSLLISLATSPLYASSGTFRLDPVMDSVMLAGGASLLGADVLMGKVFNAGHNKWNGVMPDRQSVNAFDRMFMAPYSKPLDITSTVLQYTCIAAPAVLFAAGPSEYLNVGVMYAESLMWAYGFKELAKICVSRARPYMYFPGAPEKDIAEFDWDNSFFSGHTTASFCGATFASYVFCKYYPESPWRFAVVAGSYTLAMTVACMRVAGGDHFVSDVLTGALVGSACGFLVPFLHTVLPKNDDDKVSLDVTPVCFSVSLRF